VARLKGNNIMIFGLGRFGETILHELLDTGIKVRAVETHDKIDEYKGQVREIFSLDCTSDAALEQADIASSDKIIIAFGEGGFEDKLSIIDFLSNKWSPKEISEKLIVRTSSIKREKIINNFGVSSIVFPERDEGMRVAKGILWDVTGIEDHGDGYYTAHHKTFPKLVGKSVADAHLRRKYQLNLVQIKRIDGTIIEPPSPEDVMMEKDILSVRGHENAITNFIGDMG